MTELSAFVGHSFDKRDEEVVAKFLEFFDHVAGMPFSFSWDHAEEAEPKKLSQKVREKIEDKNLFIGICTAKEHAVSTSKLKQPFFMRNSLCAPENEFLPKTSDWILQEIGCAFGRDMHIILLKEKNLRDPGGIQGDLEYITFERDRPEASFNSILEMIQSLMPRIREQAVGRADRPETQELDRVGARSEAQTTPRIQKDWQADDFNKALFRAIALDENKYETEVYETFLESDLADDPRVTLEWQVRRKFYRTNLGKSDHLDELIKLASDNPDNGLVQFFLGVLYAKYEQNLIAADYFKRSAELADSPQKRAERLIRSSRELSRAGDYAKSVSVIETVKALDREVPNLESLMLETLAETRESEGEIDQHFALMEAYLEVRPNDHGRRFDLAYKYSENNGHDLALYHYHILADQGPGEWVFNNLGASYAELDLPAKSVEAYRSSQSLGGTLAISNLARKLISAGFLVEAEDLTKEALNIEDYDKAIGTAISRIKEVRADEESSEENIVKALRPRREFYSRFGRACLEERLPDLKAVLSGSQYDLEVRVKDNKFYGSGSFEEREKSAPWISRLTGSASNGNDVVSYQVEINGTVIGHAISYTQWTFKVEDGRDDDPDSYGLIVAAGDIDQLDGYRIGEKKTEAFFRFEAMPVPENGG